MFPMRYFILLFVAFGLVILSLYYLLEDYAIFKKGEETWNLIASGLNIVRTPPVYLPTIILTISLTSSIGFITFQLASNTGKKKAEKLVDQATNEINSDKSKFASNMEAEKQRLAEIAKELKSKEAELISREKAIQTTEIRCNYLERRLKGSQAKAGRWKEKAERLQQQT